MTMQVDPIANDGIEETLDFKNRLAQELYSLAISTSLIMQRLLYLNESLQLVLVTNNKYLQARIFCILGDIDYKEKDQIYWYKQALKAAQESKDLFLYNQILSTFLSSIKEPQ